MSQDNPFAYYEARLEGRDPPLENNTAQLGFWRLVHADRSSEPVAIWTADDEPGTKIARVGVLPPTALNDGLEAAFFERVFTRCSKLPITEESYFDVMDALEAGKPAPWPDLPPAVMGQFSNLPPSPEEALRQQIAGERENVDAWLREIGEIKTQEHADKAANWATQIAELERQAEEHRKALKKPHDDACAAIQATWCPIRDGAKELVRRLKTALTPFEVEKKRREDEERRAAIAANQAPPSRSSSGSGTRGVVSRRLSVSTTKRAEIVDFDACLAGFKDNLELRELVQKLADRVARAGGEPKGCIIRTVESVV